MDEWQLIETRPDEGEFLAWDPGARKQDVCVPTIVSIYEKRVKVGERKSCEAAQSDGVYGPYDDEFQGDCATHWRPLPSPPTGKE